MTWERIACRWNCGNVFENLKDRKEHEACHTDPMPKAGTMTQEEWKEYIRNLEECEVEYPDSPVYNEAEDCEAAEDE
jgi:hypothetical protein